MYLKSIEREWIDHGIIYDRIESNIAPYRITNTSSRLVIAIYIFYRRGEKEKLDLVCKECLK